MSRYKSLVFAGVTCGLIATVLCLFAAPTPAATSWERRHSTHAPRDFGEPRGDLLQPIGTVHSQGLDAVQHLPLALKDHFRLPPWSGNARFGFGVDKDPIEQYNVSLLGADWYVNFGFRSDPPPLFDLEYVQTILLAGGNYSPSQEHIERYARAQPGTLWLVGNEPDAQLQDCVTPEEYAPLYHEVYGIIKGVDPSAKIAIGGVVQGTPLRLRYLDMILEE